MTERGLLYNAYRAVRDSLEGVPVLRDMITISVLLKNTAFDGSARQLSILEEFFTKAEDPFGFARPEEQVRFQRALRLIELAAKDRPLHNVYEMGCAEGYFTRMFAGRCQHVRATDASPTAIRRAKVNCREFPQVEFEVANIREDAFRERYDLIVSLGVLEYVYDRSLLRRLRDSIVAAIEPGGFLLLGTTHSPLEQRFYGKWFLRGVWLNRFVGEHPELATIELASDDAICRFEHVLFQKKWPSR